MKTSVSVALGATLVLFAVGGEVCALEGGTTSSKQTSPLSQAADEFKVLTRDLGMRPESPPRAQERHGSKMRWHGRIYENFRNDVLDAIPHEVKQNGESVSPLRRNQFGFNISGPVLFPHLITNPNNTFFMLSYEGVRERIFRATLLTVPTTQQRRGDFSQTVDSAGQILPIYDPAQTAPNPAYDPTQAVSTSNLQYLRAQFPGNVIPTYRLSSVAQQALTLYSAPNTDIGPFFQNNYFVNSPQIDDADGIIAKVDHPFRERHRLTSNTTVSSGYLSPSKYFPNEASPTSPEQHFSTLRSELDYVFTASTNTVNSASLAVNSDVVQSGSGTATAFPTYSLGNYLSMGTAYPNSRNARTTLDLSDAWSTRKGKHSLHLTGEAAFSQVNSFNPTYPSGYFQFTADISSLPGIIDTGDPFAGFLLGLPASAQRTITTAPSYFRNSYQGFTARDRYAARKNLTLNASFTFSRRTPRTEKYNRQSTVDPNLIDPSNGLPGALAFAGSNGISRGMRPVNYDIDPSLSVTWNPRGNSKTVVRASYSRSHAQIPIYNGQWATQGFNAIQTFVSPNTQLSPAIDLTAGIPPFGTTLPNLSPSAADNTTADYMNLSKAEPIYQSAALSIEREVPFSITVSIGANHSVGRDLLVGDGVVNPNAISPADMIYGNNLYDYSFRSTLQPYPQYTGFELYWQYQAGRYQRDAGYMRIEKRASFGLTFTAYYEFSKQLDDYSGPYGNQDLFNLGNDWSVTTYNTPQYVTLSYMYEFPFGPNQPLLNFSGIGGALVRGWSLSGNAYWNDGTPLAPHPEFNNTGDILSALNVNLAPGVSPHVSNPGPSQWYSPAAFEQPADFTMGNGPRTESGLLGPGYNSMDVSLGKRLPLGGERAFEFNATALNVLNHANWNYPDMTIGPASAPNLDAGRIIGSHGGRVIQLGLKFSF
ncbi:MAG: hypothetical protein ABSA59_16095 [Terriglobia bacterium]|jgi:hypothetical protein